VMTLLYIMTKPDLDRIPLAERKEEQASRRRFLHRNEFPRPSQPLRSLVQETLQDRSGRSADHARTDRHLLQEDRQLLTEQRRVAAGADGVAADGPGKTQNGPDQ